MKQVLRLWLAALLLLLCSVPALAFTDMEGLQDTELAAVAALSDMGVINGYPDGTFRPDEPLSRAEFAKMLCVFAVQDQLDAEEPVFADVPLDAWYAGWVAQTAQLGWMSGYPGGEFRPQAQISQQEVVAVLLRLSGVDTAGLAWPDAYITAAEEAGLLEELDFNGIAEASRLLTCSMFYKLLPQQPQEDAADEHTEGAEPMAAVADGFYLGVVENVYSGENGMEAAFYYTEQSLPLAASLRSLPTAGLFIYYTVQQGSIDEWHTLLDAGEKNVAAASPLTRAVVPDGPYRWASWQTGQEMEKPVELNSVKPLVQYISYRNLNVGQSRVDSTNYWLRDDTLFFEINADGQVQPGSRDSLELKQAVVVLADKNSQARYVFCYISD